MASLQYSFTVLATTPNPRSSSLTKPSQLASGNARRSHRFQVSCSSGGGGRVDRRNMLLGLGGLYGASSLISDRKAETDPLEAPDLSKCETDGAWTTRNGERVDLDVNCCPPYTDVQNDYTLPVFPRLRIRPAAHRLTPEYIQKFNLAIEKMKELDKTDPDDPRGFMQHANIHCAYCNGPYNQVGQGDLDLQVHNSWIFFPFHRWYLYFFERIMGELIGDPMFALPYWNWDNPMGMQMPGFYNEPAIYNVNRDLTHLPPAVVALTPTSPPITDCILQIRNNLAQLYNEMIGDVASVTDFMGDPYITGSELPSRSNAGTLEGNSHNGVHIWVGNPANPNREDMGNFYSSGREPLFYTHHANVDRMWTIWKSIPTSYSKEIEDTDAYKADDFNKSAFMFYDEKKNLVRVTVAQCLDHTKLGYVYEHSDTPWMTSRAAQRAIPVNTKDLSEKAQTADKVFPLTPTETVRVLVPKPSKGKADEVLVLQNIVTDSSNFVKFDVFVNDEDDKPQELDRAEYAGGFTQVPHRSRAKESASDLRNNLKELYENINIADDDFVVVTIVPHFNGGAVTIGGIKIVPRKIITKTKA